MSLARRQREAAQLSVDDRINLSRLQIQHAVNDILSYEGELDRGEINEGEFESRIRLRLIDAIKEVIGVL